MTGKRNNIYYKLIDWDKRMAEELIKIKGVGFGVRVDRRRKHNLISPLLLDFFNVSKAKNVSIEGCFVDYRFDDIFRYVGKGITRCSDNRLRKCKVYNTCFEYEGCHFTLPFHLDRNLEVPALLGQAFDEEITTRTKNELERAYR